MKKEFSVVRSFFVPWGTANWVFTLQIHILILINSNQTAKYLDKSAERGLEVQQMNVQLGSGKHPAAHLECTHLVVVGEIPH